MSVESLIGYPTVSGARIAIDPKQFNSRLGIHSVFPAATPKYSYLEGVRGDYLDTQARMFVQVPAVEYEKFLASLTDMDSKALASVLAGDEDSVGGMGYIDFGLELVRMQFNEKMQITETLADNSIVFFFGQSIPIFTFIGHLLNTRQNDWAQSFLKIYQDIIRGTRLAERNKVLRVRWNEKIASGAIFNLQMEERSDNELIVPFTFQAAITALQLFPIANLEPTQLDNAFPFSPSEEYRLKDSTSKKVPKVKGHTSPPKRSNSSKGTAKKEELVNREEDNPQNKIPDSEQFGDLTEQLIRENFGRTMDVRD